MLPDKSREFSSKLSDDKQALLRAQVGADFKELQEQLDTMDADLRLNIDRLYERVEALETMMTASIKMTNKNIEMIEHLNAACEFCLRQEDKPNE